MNASRSRSPNFHRSAYTSISINLARGKFRYDFLPREKNIKHVLTAIRNNDYILFNELLFQQICSIDFILENFQNKNFSSTLGEIIWSFLESYETFDINQMVPFGRKYTSMRYVFFQNFQNNCLFSTKIEFFCFTSVTS